MTKKTATKRTTTKKRVKTNLSKSGAREAGRGGAAAGQLQAGSTDAAKDLATLYVSLKSDAKTPDQHADAAIVGLAQQHLEKGDHETMGSLLNKVGTWVGDKVSTFARDHKEDFTHAAQHLLLRLIQGH